MKTIAILSDQREQEPNEFTAICGDGVAKGRTPGEALDALTAGSKAEPSTTRVVMQNLQADRFFPESSRNRLSELMARWRDARDTNRALASDDLAELERLVDEEMLGATLRGISDSTFLEPDAAQDEIPTAVALACVGTPDAFQIIIERYWSSVFDYLRGFVSNERKREELTRETFLRAYLKLSTLREEMKLSTWLFALARDVAPRANMRLSAKRRKRLMQTIYAPLSEPGQGTDATEENAANDERAAQDAFTRAHYEFIRGRYREAHGQFRELLENYPQASEIASRARVYLALSQKRLMTLGIITDINREPKRKRNRKPDDERFPKN